MAGPATPELVDIDAFGVTHPGRIRSENQDHFFVGSLSRGIVLNASSLGPAAEALVLPHRVASLGVVADGVGGVRRGGDAARLAVQALVAQVSSQFHDACVSERTDPEVVEGLLKESALRCHSYFVDEARKDGNGTLATTLTLFLGLWPHGYLLQVGDSRCYVFQDGVLTQQTRDQTMAAELVQQGQLSPVAAEASHWSNILSSSLGGPEAHPQVTRFRRDWGTVILLCSDGLTKHVSNEHIRDRLATMANAEQVCRALLQDALDGGGSDNITIVVGRTVPRAGD